ncbi:HNH endonuclease [Brevundimonas sp. TWP1-2-1b1]|uniref:HNH endonuclease n=1 Tax=unclassified Brevundimonas TaxID=2622653 RepID=UPI003CF84252
MGGCRGCAAGWGDTPKYSVHLQSRSYHHLYDHRWAKAAKAFLDQHPLCRFHEDQGRTVAAQCVDHIQPHRGDLKLFWERTNWQPLCNPCHNSLKKQIESRGHHEAVGLDGFPTDPNHPFNKRS